HKALERHKVERCEGEWFRCDVDAVRAAYIAVLDRKENVERRCANFDLRPEQREAIERAAEYFQAVEREGRVPKFLWNAKMRFGKTFATYRLAKKLGFKRVLILTFKPTVQAAWRDDLTTHVDFEGWRFVARPDNPKEPDLDEQYRAADPNRPIVCFGSFQDFLRFDKKTKKIKPQNQWVHTLDWDLVVFDEYHFGAWRDSAQSLFANVADNVAEEAWYEELEKTREQIEKNDESTKEKVRESLDETCLPIKAKRYLYLSGTPFRALSSGEFIEEQIYNWTYADEQRAKENWNPNDGPNPYAALPKMAMLTYKIPESIRKIAERGEFNEFDLNLFFSAEGEKKEARFQYEDYVQKWLDLIRGAYLETAESDLKLGADASRMPFADGRLLDVLSHTLWFLPSVASCYAMSNLLNKERNSFYRVYDINVCAGPEAGVGVKALAPVEKSMRDPLNTKTITLTCGKLTTGATVKPWSGVFMLRNLSSPETYFQAAFRVQSPWEIDADDGRKEIVKTQCYLLDFAIERALKQIADYCCRLNVSERSPERKVADFIRFLPVLAFDGASMSQIDAAGILDFVLSGTSATLLAKRWDSSLLVNVDVETLARLTTDERAMAALSQIPKLETLSESIQTIINESEVIKKAQKENDASPTKKELEKSKEEYKNRREEIQIQLRTIARSIPLFMYLSDFREECLRDVITQPEKDLFKIMTDFVRSAFSTRI
ncbi:MAG: hypothetical protein IJX36_05345, partial [Thermoguttaceae bacterium]|nr:hypothetical protein [Thermoguttaceae bacterium]MBQ9128896.1 hypothetical protein [Thermoguttaceae bacterium]